MPTENRSSTTELSKIVTEALVGMVSGVTGMKPPADEPLPGFIQAPIDRAVTRISELLAQPSPQPHPEPIAWMVGTAFWWTKEEAERDAAEAGLPIVGLGPMTDRTATELAESETMAAIAELAECEAMADMVAEREWAEHVGTGDVSSKVEAAFTQLHNDLHEAVDKLAERDALLKEVLIKTDKWMLPDLYERIRLSFKPASAELGAPTPQTINGHKLNCKAVDEYKPGDCSCSAEPDSKS
ncbi:hypothetical protein [Pseudomonas sp. UBA4617]|uniref:hypothetical protein n=1 Tax=Pseudomonas sp. UBA4617 TaxID=1947318 RepID=UPI0025D3EFA9|nr:hypothetical protein [Pseudomonas sp. UBA4617]